jgi:hypothetical protein
MALVRLPVRPPVADCAADVFPSCRDPTPQRGNPRTEPLLRECPRKLTAVKAAQCRHARMTHIGKSADVARRSNLKRMGGWT